MEWKHRFICKCLTLDGNTASVTSHQMVLHLLFSLSIHITLSFLLKFVLQVLAKRNMTPAAAELSALKDKLVKMELDHIAITTSQEKEYVCRSPVTCGLIWEKSVWPLSDSFLLESHRWAPCWSTEPTSSASWKRPWGRGSRTTSSPVSQCRTELTNHWLWRERFRRPWIHSSFDLKQIKFFNFSLRGTESVLMCCKCLLQSQTMRSLTLN